MGRKHCLSDKELEGWCFPEKKYKDGDFHKLAEAIMSTKTRSSIMAEKKAVSRSKKSVAKKPTKKNPGKSKLEIINARRKRIDNVLETFDQYKETGDADFDKALKSATLLLKRYDRVLERRATRLEDEE